MKRRQRQNVWLLVTLLAAGLARADIAVVVAKNNAIGRLSEQEVREFFFKTRAQVGDISLVPVDHHDASLRTRFYQHCCHRTPLQVKAYWSRLVFSGRAQPPLILATDAPVSSQLNAEQDWLTYIDVNDLTADMKPVLIMKEEATNGQ